MGLFDIYGWWAGQAMGGMGAMASQQAMPLGWQQQAMLQGQFEQYDPDRLQYVRNLQNRLYEALQRERKLMDDSGEIRPKPVKPTEIPAGIKQLYVLTDRLTNSSEELENKLSTVTRNEPDAPLCQDREPASTPMGSDLNALQDKLELIFNRIEKIVRTLEV